MKRRITYKDVYNISDRMRKYCDIYRICINIKNNIIFGQYAAQKCCILCYTKKCSEICYR